MRKCLNHNNPTSIEKMTLFVIKQNSKTSLSVACFLFRSGINQWRDSQKPVEILKWYCLKNRLGEVNFNGPTLSIGNKMYKLTDFGEYGLAAMQYHIASLCS